jgi:hypothetical protein
MSDGLNQSSDTAVDGLPPWRQCDLFCIKDYADLGPAPCGWRGRFHEAERDVNKSLVCPRCGRATLIRIRSPRVNEPPR